MLVTEGIPQCVVNNGYEIPNCTSPASPEPIPDGYLVCAFHHDTCGVDNDKGCNSLGLLTGTIYSNSACPKSCYADMEDIDIQDKGLPCTPIGSGDPTPCYVNQSGGS